MIAVLVAVPEVPPDDPPADGALAAGFYAVAADGGVPQLETVLV